MPFLIGKKYKVIQNKKPYSIISAQEYVLNDKPYFYWISNTNKIEINCSRSENNWKFKDLIPGDFFIAEKKDKTYKILKIYTSEKNYDNQPNSLFIKHRF